jgi:hypothetical protein
MKTPQVPALPGMTPLGFKPATVKTVNPLKHPFPHAKLYNVKLTSITRLNKNTAALRGCYVQDGIAPAMKEAA